MDAEAPEGVACVSSARGVRVRVRAGAVGWQGVAGLVVSMGWSVAWGYGLARGMAGVREGTALNPWPGIFLCGVATTAGIYCTLLCVWAMMGHDTLVVARGGLWVANAWLLGLRTRLYDLAKVTVFSCAGEDCGMQADAESCCCRWSTVDYALSFGYEGRRVPVFPQLARPAKDWLRDRLNEVLRSADAQGI